MGSRCRRNLASFFAAAVVALNVGACSEGAGWHGVVVAVPCTLGPDVDGDLVREGDHAVLANARFNLTSWQEPLELRWPTGWTSRATDDGELELLDADGVARARTGMRVAIGAVADVGSPRVRDGVLEVCPSGPDPVHDVGP